MLKKKTLSVILALSIILACVPLFSVSAADTEIEFGLFSDTHYYPNSLKGGICDEYLKFSNFKSKEYTENNALLSNALDGVEIMLQRAESSNAKYLLIPGDLTKDGEYEGHVELAQKLEDWEKKTGIPVFVTNGNHDVNNSGACSFVNNKKEPARKTTPEEFREIYKNLGWDMADSTFTPKEYSPDYDGVKGGMLSYAANLGDGFRLIVVDTNIYSVDNGAKKTEHLTDGQVGDELLEWVVSQAKQAKRDGLTPIVMQHHNLVPHMDIEEATFWAFVCYDWERIADTYADAGIHYVFTGHLHASDTSSYISDNGEEITDILSPTLTGYPNYFRNVKMSTDGRNTTLNLFNHDIDDESLGLPQIVSDTGVVYDRPYKYTQSYPATFGLKIQDFADRSLELVINNYFTEINEAGGIIPFLKTKGVDVQQLLINLLGTDGFSIGNKSILTVSKNAMSFINNLDKQIMNQYITKPQETKAKVMALIEKLLSVQVSEYPCTYNYEVLNSTPTGKPCTFGEYATTALLLYYEGDENLYGKEGYEYVKDTLDRFESGENAEKVFNVLIDVVVNDLVRNEILSSINFNPGELFPEDSAFTFIGRLIQSASEKLLSNNNTFANLIDKVLSLKIVPKEYRSIDDILNTLVVDKYLTPSQFEAWGTTMAWMIKSLVFDDNPDAVKDNNVTVTYSGKTEVEATKDNFRLPSDIVMNLGENDGEVTITYITKYSITDTDIELLPFSENPVFTSTPTKSGNIKTGWEYSDRSYPGADLGIIGMFDLSKTYVKHTVTLTGLTPGASYSYRVGFAEKGWWSNSGKITVPGGKDEAFTFFNITDPQAQTAKQYETYGKVISAANALYPGARLVVSNGDQVDLGTTSKQWNYFFNSTDAFLNLPFMPAAGNQEKSGSILKTVFTLPGIPEQDETSGTYYSYDYNNAHFTVLNTNDIVKNKLSDKQLQWMIDDIKNSESKWKIVVMHKALYCNGIYVDNKEIKGLRNQLAALLPYLGVDLVLTGQDHVYTRTGAMNSGASVPTMTKNVVYNGKTFSAKINPKGTVYSTIGQAGIKEYKTVSQSVTSKYFPGAESYLDKAETMFSAITVDGDGIYYTAYTVDNDANASEADSFAIFKTKDTAPIDKIGNNAIAMFIAKLLSRLNITISWRLTNIFYSVVSAVSRFFGMK
ncbi:MAG: metallophosphoesterase [Clostridiales bacterium]|nr:metallophosphoesterase [Clostridiales bacterium]